MNNKQNKPKVLKRILKELYKSYPVLMTITIICIIFSAVVASIPDIVIQKVVAIVNQFHDAGNVNFDEALKQIGPLLLILVGLYLLSILAVLAYTQLMAIITQGFLNKMRQKMFNKMQNLPIRYFDQNKTGDIMSRYTNDIDTLRELVSQSLPTIIRAGTLVIAVFIIMMYYSFYMTLLIIVGVSLMILVSRKFGGRSARHFIALQKTVGKAEGYVQEMMNGQKVIKVFNHEKKCIDEYHKINDEVFNSSYKANAFANMLGPVIMNIGNLLYVLAAIFGGILLVLEVPNVSLSMKALDISIVVAFLNMTKQFTGNVNQLSQQANSIVMGMAGANRIFELLDSEDEVDNGYVTLVNAIIDKDGNVTESSDYTGKWAWKHPHGDGTTTYTILKGDVVLDNVDFEYRENHPILHNISIYANKGQKVALVGATGAGKTTITNLLNRFYDIADGKIRYDGININKIKKADLRRSLGLVLQETNLFTGTVMDNIRYGNTSATDNECIEAAKLAGADDFIRRLPDGYNTLLANNGSNLSQGQRQLIAISRAAVANPPVMILDEATSSIDTRTEAIVQKGMDKLMEGRTVFVIAHRLSTVMNSDVIMVMDHGRIIERGTHEHLLEEKGVYYQLFTGAFELE